MGVTHHRVLSCSDFPPRPGSERSPFHVESIVDASGVGGPGYTLVMSDRGPSNPREPSTSSSVAVWSGPHASIYAEGTAARLGSSLVGTGSAPTGQTTDSGSDGLATFDDLRTGPHACGADAVLLADRTFDPTMNLQGAPRLCTLEPLVRPSPASEPVLLVGLLVRSPGYMAARQVLDDFGPISSMHVTSHCGPGQGSLYARLFDAVSLVLTLLGAPDLIDAMLVPPTPPAGSDAKLPPSEVPDVPVEGLARLSGDLGVLVRCQPLGLATISASDQASWERTATLLGPSGTLKIHETGISWTGTGGREIESWTREAPPFELACRQAAIEVDRWLAGNGPKVLEVDETLATATCEATRLSCRTREPESTERVRDLLSRT